MRNRVALVLAGGLAFWAPVVLLEGLSGGKYSLIVANVLPVASSLCLYWLLRRGRFSKVRAMPLYVLGGIYLLCPLSITVASSAFGGGFTQFTGPHDTLWLLLASVVPPLGMLMAGYNGTLFGLLAVTVALVAAAIRGRRGRPLKAPARPGRP